MITRMLKLLTLLLLLPVESFAIGLTPTASRIEVIKYSALFIVGCVLIFFLLIRMIVIPFLVRNYYAYATATNIGYSLFLLYALNLFTLLFFNYSRSVGWHLIFIVIALFWLVHLLFKILLGRRSNDD